MRKFYVTKTKHFQKHSPQKKKLLSGNKQEGVKETKKKKKTSEEVRMFENKI